MKQIKVPYSSFCFLLTLTEILKYISKELAYVSFSVVCCKVLAYTIVRYIDDNI